VLTSDPDSARRTIPVVLADAGVRLDAITPEAPTLEDVFVQLVRDADG
jgi:hypothetical protein